MKRVMIALVTFLLFAMPFAYCLVQGEPGGSPYQERIIRAYKNIVSTTEPPEPYRTIRLLDISNNEIAGGGIREIPADARNTQYSAFSWILGGNEFGKVEVYFQFYPMFRARISDSEAEGYYCMPYSVEIVHESSRIGNHTLTTVQKTAQNYSGQQSTYPIVSTIGGTSYTFYYIDSVYGSGSTATVTSGASNGYEEIGLEYYMNYATAIEDGSGNPVTNYGLDVCDSWNRVGTAIITLQIDSNGKIPNTNTSYPDGYYYATVVAGIKAP